MGALTDLAIKNAKAGRLHDGDGLILMVKPTGSKFWVLRIMKHGKRREIGLGSYLAAASVEQRRKKADLLSDAELRDLRKLTLAEVRLKARLVRGEAKSGVDVIGEKRAAKVTAKAKANDQGERTFEAVAKLAHAARMGLADKTNALWLARLQQYAFPAFGASPVDKVDGPAIIAALEPIWHDKPETARRLRRAISSVLKYASARQWRGSVPPLSDLTKDAFPTPQAALEHHPAVDYPKASTVVTALRAAPETMGRFALLFTVYTAARSGETRLATWAEIDLAKAEWTIPAARMKMKRDHVVPLSSPALAILATVAKLRRVDGAAEGNAAALVFPGERAGRPMSDMTMSKAQKLVAPDTVPHGWRSTFRDWAAEATDHPADVCEAALAHLIGNATTRSYQRGTMLDKRRALMDDWAAYLAPAPAVTAEPATVLGEVIAFRARKRVAG